MNERGFTLIETVVAAAVLCIVLAAAIPLRNGARAASAQASAAQFDAAAAYARSLAATSGNGATIVIGTHAIAVYAGRPTSAAGMTASAIAPMNVGAAISETSLGSAPLTIFFDSAGEASAASGAVTPGQIMSTDPGCPAGENAITLSIADSRVTLTRTLPCKR